MVTQSEDMQDRATASVSAADTGQIARGFYESVSQRKRRAVCPWWSSPIHLEYGAFVFPTGMISVWFHHVGIRSHHFQTMLTQSSFCFSHFFQEETHCFCLRKLIPSAKTSGQIKRNGGMHSQQKQCVICFKTLNRDLGNLSKRPLNSSLAENYILKSLK